MKKLFALLLTSILLVTSAGCGNASVQHQTPTQPPTSAPPEKAPENPALTVMQTIWTQFKGDKEAYLGGFGEDHRMAEPWQLDLSNEDFLQGALFLSEEQLAKVTAAASLMHGLNTNNLTVGAVVLKEGTDDKVFASEIKNRILDNQWVCGRPGGMRIVKVEDCLLILYGTGSYAGGFVEALQQAYPEAQTLCQESI